MSIDGFTVDMLEASVIAPAHLPDVYLVSVQREEVEGLQAWVCSIFNLSAGVPVVLTDEADCYPAPTWQAAETWWRTTMANMGGPKR